MINGAFVAVHAARTTFLPTEKVAPFNKDVAEFFLIKALKEQANQGLQIFCLEKAINFGNDKENLVLFASWIKDGKIVIKSEELKSELTSEHKYAIILTYYASPEFTLDEKKALKEKTFENDKSDRAIKIQERCEYSLPDAELKAKLWQEITNLDSKDGV